MSIRPLFVDDEVGQRETMKDILESLRFHVTTAVHGYGALEKIASEDAFA